MKFKRINKSLKVHKCECCEKPIPKGTVYYNVKEICKWDNEAVFFEFKMCPRCKYTQEINQKRFEKFKLNCHHPITYTEYRYIPGEAVMEPYADKCRICGEVI